MKIHLWKLTTLLFAALLSSCNDETDFTSQQAAVRFTLADAGTQGQTNLNDLPEGSSLLITLEDANGELLYDMEPIGLINQNGSLMTEALNLPRGNYKLVDFVIISNNDQVLYATPKRGSTLADGVQLTLPHSFMLSNESLNLLTNVVNVQSASKKEFGYAGRIIADQRHFAMEVEAYGPNESGYDENAVKIFMRGAGTIAVNWGDGTTETYNLTTENSTEVAHQYSVVGTYQITITGDLNGVTSFNTAYGGYKIYDIRFKPLTNLEDLSIVLFSNSPSIINLTRNYQLTSVSLDGLQQTKDILLPSEHKIISISIAGENMLTTKAVDKIIHNIYWSVRSNPREGEFALQKSWAQQPEDTEMVGPPSSYSFNKLRSLRDNYSWEIYPNF